MASFRRHIIALSSASVLTAATACAPDLTTAPPAAAPPTGPLLMQAASVTGNIVSYQGPVEALRASTGNLYWVSHSYDDVAGPSAAIWRTGKTSSPGTEQRIHLETATLPADVRIRGFTFAQVGGAWYGYFGSCRRSSLDVPERCTIKRVGLGGGSTTSLGFSQPPIISNLETDGTHLFWADEAGALRRLSVDGGTVTVLAQSAVGRPISTVRAHGLHVYFTDSRSVRRVRKDGTGAVEQLATGTSIHQLHVVATNSGMVITYSDSDARLFAKNLSSGITTPLSTSQTGWIITSLASDGAYRLWSACQLAPNSTTELKSGTCYIRRQWEGGGAPSEDIVTGSTGIRFVQGDAYSVFSRVENYLFRYTL
jgi:hypothetical protein